MRLRAAREWFREGGTAEGEPWCPDGSPVLIVRNHSGVRLEIIETRSGSGGRNTVVAYAGPGTTEVSIRRDPDYHYSARPVGGETTAAAETRPRARDRQIDFSRECRR